MWWKMQVWDSDLTLLWYNSLGGLGDISRFSFFLSFLRPYHATRIGLASRKRGGLVAKYSELGKCWPKEPFMNSFLSLVNSFPKSIGIGAIEINSGQALHAMSVSLSHSSISSRKPLWPRKMSQCRLIDNWELDTMTQVRSGDWEKRSNNSSNDYDDNSKLNLAFYYTKQTSQD